MITSPNLSQYDPKYGLRQAPADVEGDTYKDN